MMPLRTLLTTAVATLGTLVSASAAPPPKPSRSLAPKPPTPSVAEPATAPAALRDQLRTITRAFDGSSGIAIVSLRDGWEASWNGDKLFPQQSCSKLWVAITAMDAVDRGRIRLSNKVTLTRDDLTLFHQPIRQKILTGPYTTTLGALLFQAVTESDNTANDRLLRAVGGSEAVRAMIARKGLGAIRFYEGERKLQSRIAGLTWQPSYSYGNAFETARAALPMPVRQAAFDRYLTNPYDGAAPRAVANALARLKAGQLLSPTSTAELLSIMGSTRTGKLRVRAGLAPGWSWNHKTGTGQQLGGRIGGINDIGLLTAPDGAIYAMSIMTVPNRADGGAQDLMQAVARAVIAQHRTRRARQV
ncbi:serine hydrolase [Sphingomonas piscis]|uniref:beta-lactamase n=2 Tax=Sphingomonas piscis TaxID=2714943 RepID=A0A6G7YTD9_9SPHN|nr:serine hydrolase [Sphingomonas piscis]